MFEVIINGDKKITGSMGLWKRSEDGPIESVGMDTSVGLQELMESKLDICGKINHQWEQSGLFIQSFFQIIKVRVIKLKTKYCKAILLGIYEDEDEAKKKKLSLYIWSVVTGNLDMGRFTCKNHLDFQHEMVQIVRSKEVEKLIEEELKELDPNALTPKL